MLPNPIRQPTSRRTRIRPWRLLEPNSDNTRRVGRRREPPPAACGEGRSRLSSSRSSFVRARYAADIRSVNSSSVSRPSARCSRRSATVRSRSASEALSAGVSLIPACFYVEQTPASRPTKADGRACALPSGGNDSYRVRLRPTCSRSPRRGIRSSGRRPGDSDHR